MTAECRQWAVIAKLNIREVLLAVEKQPLSATAKAHLIGACESLDRIMSEGKRGEPTNTQRIDALDWLVRDANTKQVWIAQGCYCLIGVGRKTLLNDSDLRIPPMSNNPAESEFNGGQKKANLLCVYGNSDDNKDFADATPSGGANLMISKGRPAQEVFTPGREFYVYFVPVEEDNA